MLSILLTLFCCAGAVKAAVDEEYEQYSYDDITVNGKRQEESATTWTITNGLLSDKSNIIKGSNSYAAYADLNKKGAVGGAAKNPATLTATYNLGAFPAFKTISRSNGDKFYEANVADIARLENEIKKSIYTLYDDDKIFAKYSHLKGLARNKAFEMAQKAKQR